jgi:hypothetical protein
MFLCLNKFGNEKQQHLSPSHSVGRIPCSGPVTSKDEMPSPVLLPAFFIIVLGAEQPLFSAADRV